MTRFRTPAAGLLLLQLAMPPSALADAGHERFVASGYVRCDAVILGAHWGESAERAKVRVGKLLGQGRNQEVQVNLADARNRGHRCEFADTGFSDEDAEAVAEYWEVEVDEAMTTLAEQVSLGQRREAHDAVAEAHQAYESEEYEE